MFSLTVRLLVWTAAWLLPLQIAVGLASYSFLLGRDRALLDDQLERQVHAAGQVAGVMALNDDVDGLVHDSTPPKMRHENESASGFQYWGDGNALEASSANLARVPLDAAPVGFADVTVDGRRWRMLTVLSHGRWIRVAQSSDVRDALATAGALQILVLLAASLPILFVALRVGVARSLASVKNLAEQLSASGPGRDGPVGGGEIPRELEPVVRSINVLRAKCAGRPDIRG